MGEHHVDEVPARADRQVRIAVAPESRQRGGCLGGELQAVGGELGLDAGIRIGHRLEDRRGVLKIRRHAEGAAGDQRGCGSLGWHLDHGHGLTKLLEGPRIASRRDLRKAQLEQHVPS